jgi:hypothetical protein
MVTGTPTWTHTDEQFVTDQMTETLRRLQRVPARVWNVDVAYAVCYGGIQGLDPRRSTGAQLMIYAKSLAFHVWWANVELGIELHRQEREQARVLAGVVG